jgi:anti-sigma B factor antagonist
MSAEPHPTTTPDGDQAPFTCEVLPERNAVRVRPVGSLDIATVPVLEQQLQELRDAGFRRLILDLGRLSFMDSTGLRLALSWAAAARQDGFEIDFMPGQPMVQRLFELTGTTDRVSFIRS